jgi:hypothetical protein
MSECEVELEKNDAVQDRCDQHCSIFVVTPLILVDLSSYLSITKLVLIIIRNRYLSGLSLSYLYILHLL